MNKKLRITLIVATALAVIAVTICIVGANYRSDKNDAPEETTMATTTTAAVITTVPETTTPAATTTEAIMTTEEITTTEEVTTNEFVQTLAPIETPAPEVQQAYDNGDLVVKPATTTTAVQTTAKPAVTTTNNRGWTAEQQALYDMNSDLDPNFDPTAESEVVTDDEWYGIYAQ